MADVSHRNSVLRRLVLLASATATIACTGDATPVYVGIAGPWEEPYGQMNRRGIDLAVEEINASGGVAGRELRLVVRDDKGEGSRAAAIAADFVANGAVVGVVGHVTSGAMMAAARVYDGELAALSTTASTPDLSGLSSWVFRVIPSDSATGLGIAQFLNARGTRRVAILYENTSYGRGLAEAFRRHYRGQVVAADPIPADPDASFEPYVSFLHRRAPEMVVVAGTEGSARALLREARRQRLASEFIGGDGWTGIVADTALAEGVFVAAPFTAQDTRGDAARFVAAFRRRYQMDPDGNAALAYDATRLLARAIAEGGASRARVREVLASLGEREAFAGATGAIRFEPSGDVADRSAIITRVRRGALLVERGSAGS